VTLLMMLLNAVFSFVNILSFAGRIVEQQHRHVEKKRELLASRSVKMPIVGDFPAGLGNSPHRAAPVDHARLIIQLCVPDARYIFLSV
jgi:hypothetical protein